MISGVVIWIIWLFILMMFTLIMLIYAECFFSLESLHIVWSITKIIIPYERANNNKHDFLVHVKLKSIRREQQPTGPLAKNICLCLWNLEVELVINDESGGVNERSSTRKVLLFQTDSTYDDFGHTVRITVWWWSPVLKVALSLLSNLSWDTNTAATISDTCRHNNVFFY